MGPAGFRRPGPNTAARRKHISFSVFHSEKVTEQRLLIEVDFCPSRLWCFFCSPKLRRRRPAMATENYGGKAAIGRRERPVIISPASISNLGDDLLFNVLIRLPNPKSAFRCKSVCKRWNSLISAPYFFRHFVSHHRILSAGVPPLLIHSDSHERRLLPSEIRCRSVVLDCFKDLLLLGVEKRPYNDRRKIGRRFLLCNPFTKQWVSLPLAPPMRRLMSFWPWTARLACEPCNSITLDLGDGEEITHNADYRFRVVRMYESKQEPEDAIVHVFCSNSIEWTKVVLDCRHHPSWHFEHRQLDNVVVSSNGKLYWMTPQNEIVGWNPFCLENNPALIHHSLEYFTRCFISASQGALYMISNDDWETDPDAFSVWRLEEDGWTRHYRVSMKKLMSGIIIDEHGCEIKCSKLELIHVAGQHLQKPEVIYLRGFNPDPLDFVFLSYNLMMEELELLASSSLFDLHEMVCQTRVDLWPTSIPNYDTK